MHRSDISERTRSSHHGCSQNEGQREHYFSPFSRMFQKIFFSCSMVMNRLKHGSSFLDDIPCIYFDCEQGREIWIT